MSIIQRNNVFDPFSLNLSDPFKTFDRLFDAVISASPPYFSNDTVAFADTRIDWKETIEAHVFKVDLPGVKKEEVKVELEEGGVLKISGERSKEQENKNDKWHGIERSRGKFLQSVRLPDDAKVDQVGAAMENGVLTITVPKEEVKNSVARSVEISSTSQ